LNGASRQRKAIGVPPSAKWTPSDSKGGGMLY
jgi:hypothetical protein